MSAPDEKRDTSEVRALTRDVILGAIVVILVSLAVPAWIMRVEYRKSSKPPEKSAPAAEGLRETRSERVTATPAHSPGILELAERLARQEAEKRARAHSPSPRSTNVPAAGPARAVSPAVDPPQIDSRQSMQSP
jgi:hypothetical protein